MAEITTIIARILFAWMFVLVAIIILMAQEDIQIKIGPNDSLVILGAKINTPGKYFGLLLLCVCNSAGRVMNMNILRAWVINNIQDTKIYFKVETFAAYEISAVHAMYGILDLYVTLAIILSQVDLFLIEIMVDVMMAGMTTRHYLEVKKETYLNLITHADEMQKILLASQCDFD